MGGLEEKKMTTLCPFESFPKISESLSLYKGTPRLLLEKKDPQPSLQTLSHFGPRLQRPSFQPLLVLLLRGKSPNSRRKLSKYL